LCAEEAPYLDTFLDVCTLLTGASVKIGLKSLLFGLGVQLWSKMDPSKETLLVLPGVNVTKPIKVYPVRKENNSGQD